MRIRTFALALVVALLTHLVGVRLVAEFPRLVDVFLVLVVFNGLEGRSVSGMFGGLTCGLVHDALSGGLFGLFGFADTLTGYAAALVARRLVTQRTAGVLAIFLFCAALQRATLYTLDWSLQTETALPPLPWAFVPILTSSVLGAALHAASARGRKRLQDWRWRRRSGLSSRALGKKR